MSVSSTSNTLQQVQRNALTTVLCFGDSWTDGNAYGLKEQIKKHGHTNVRVINEDYWGSTAEDFAKKPNKLPNSVSQNKADYVLLSMGGNDFKNIYWRHKQYVTPWTAVSGIEKNLRVVLDSLYAEHPNVKVVVYGYDFPGGVDQFMSMWGSHIDLSPSLKFLLWMYDWFGVRVINYSAMQLGHTYAKLAKDYSKKGFSLTYVPLWGSLQSAEKELAAPHPALGKPSPMAYMQDPIHANAAGFNVLLGNLYTAYFGKVLTVQA